MAAIDTVYNYYLSTYGNDLRPQNRYDTHKKSELRDTYNRIVKSNKESPLVKINTNDVDLKMFAIDLKESARETKNVVSSLSSEGQGIESVLNKKIAMSTNEDAVEAEYIGDEDTSHSKSDFKPFTIGVQSLATPQVNTGNYLDPNGRNFESGSLSFDLYTPSTSYEFQISIGAGDTNREVQNKILRLVNTSDIGLTARILENEKGQSALQLQSKQTGLAEGEEYLFNLQSSKSWSELNRLGIHNISQEASNSSFTLNGATHSSLSNTFTINREFEVTLKEPTSEDVAIGFKTNTEAIADGANQMVRVYNNMLLTAQRYSIGHNNSKLYSEVDGIANTLDAEFQAIGITRQDDGTLVIDKDTMAEALDSSSSTQAIASLNKFKNMLDRQADKVAINPIRYLDTLIVAYKNPGHNFSAPYAQSAYSGMMVDRSL